MELERGSNQPAKKDELTAMLIYALLLRLKEEYPPITPELEGIKSKTDISKQTLIKYKKRTNIEELKSIFPQNDIDLIVKFFDKLIDQAKNESNSPKSEIKKKLKK